MKYEIRNRFTNAVQFTAEIDCAEDASVGVKIGLAVKWAIKTGANLADAKGLDLPDPEIAAQRIRAVAQAALASDDAWHTCETTHCIAGWAIHQAGEEGRKLEAQYGAPMAGLRLLGVEAAAHFYDSNADARAWLASKLENAE